MATSPTTKRFQGYVIEERCVVVVGVNKEGLMRALRSFCSDGSEGDTTAAVSQSKLVMEFERPDKKYLVKMYDTRDLDSSGGDASLPSWEQLQNELYEVHVVLFVLPEHLCVSKPAEFVRMTSTLAQWGLTRENALVVLNTSASTQTESEALMATARSEQALRDLPGLVKPVASAPVLHTSFSSSPPPSSSSSSSSTYSSSSSYASSSSSYPSYTAPSLYPTFSASSAREEEAEHFHRQEEEKHIEAILNVILSPTPLAPFKPVQASLKLNMPPSPPISPQQPQQQQQRSRNNRNNRQVQHNNNNDQCCCVL